ncbi:MAG: T9SS type A sorting domain-containing protein [bacterium]
MKNIFYRLCLVLILGMLFTSFASSQTLPWGLAVKKFRAAQIFPDKGKVLYSIGANGAGANRYLNYSTDLGSKWNIGAQDVGVNGFGITTRYYLSSSSGLSISTDPLDANVNWVLLPPFNLTSPYTALYVQQASDGSGNDDIWAGTVNGLWHRKFNVVDSAKPWTQMSTISIGSPIRQITSAGKNYYFRTDSNIYVSNDEGMTWAKKTQTTFGVVTAILAPTENDFFHSVQTPSVSFLFRSIDGGNTFDAGTSFSTITIQTLATDGLGYVYYGGGGTDGLIPPTILSGSVRRIHLSDGIDADFSTSFPSGPPSPEVIALAFTDAKIGIAGTDVQGVWRTQVPVGVTRITTEIDGLRLSQNFPNPVASFSEFEVSSVKAVEAVVMILDALGREVRQVFSGDLGVGTTKMNLDCRSLPPGAYFYRVQTQRGVATRPFVVSH